jgi:predicted ATPase/DNA-binding CsgD family transcriptional regulator
VDRVASAAERSVRPQVRLVGRFADGIPLEPPPHPLTPLVGRERESAGIRQLLAQDEVRLCTLTGPGGIGKTRLAIQAAHDCLPDFPDGVAWVSLAPLTDPDLVLPTIAQAIGVVGPGAQPVSERIARALDGRHMLIVLDNFEHLAVAARELARLLQTAHSVTFLVTSRSPLRISGEHEFSVPPLALPGRHADRSGDLASFPAIALFEARTRSVRREFAIDESNGAAVLEICRRLEGVPLAIELAAARGKALPPFALLDRLSQGLDLLAGGPIDQPPRHQTMRAAVEWSYDLLTPSQQALFRQLSVFAGGFSLGAAAAAAAADAADSRFLDSIAALVDASLLTPAADAAEQPRFLMLETIRQFGLERLETGGELETVSNRFADWCSELANRAGAAFAGDGPGVWAGRLAQEIDNFRSALALLDARGANERILELATALAPLWSALGHQREGLQWLSVALEQTRGTAPPELSIQGSVVAARLATTVVDFQRAEQLALAARDLAVTIDDRQGTADADCVLGNLARGVGDQTEARACYDRALAIYRTLEDRYSTGYTLIQLAKLGDLGSPDDPGDPDDQATAEIMAAEALEIYRELRNRWGAARALNQVAYLGYKQGRLGESAARAGEALAMFRESGNLSEGSQCIENLADVAGAAGNAELAATLYGICEGLQERLGAPMWPIYRIEYEQEIARVRVAMAADAFEAAWAAGRELPEDAAVTTALQAAERLAQPGDDPAGAPVLSLPGNLTGREVEVLRLLATGASNQAIADTLFISVTTVKGHVQSIMRKLGLNSRTALAAYAVRQGLVPPS